MNDKVKNRPLSPHLTIYKPQITSVLSIMHRISGAYLFIGMLIFVWWIVIAVYSSSNPEIAKWDFFIDNIFGKMMLFAWSAALFFHMLNGIRHLFWDIGKGYELRTVNISGILVLIGTIVLTFLSWGIAMNG